MASARRNPLGPLALAMAVSVTLGFGLARGLQATDDLRSQLDLFSQILYLVQNNYVDPPDNQKLIRGAIDGMLRTLDPHTVFVRGSDPRALARCFLAEDDVLSLRFEPGAVVVETSKPDSFYSRLTQLATTGEAGAVDEVTSPDDNLQAVFRYLVKQ